MQVTGKITRIGKLEEGTSKAGKAWKKVSYRFSNLNCRNFDNVVRMVYDRCLKLQTHSYLLFWRSAVLSQYEYLNFKPL